MIDRDDLRDRVPPRFEGHADRLAYLAAEYKYGVYLAVGAATVLVATGRLGIPELPAWWAIVLEGVVVGAIPAAIVAKVLIIDPWIPDPRYDVLVLEGDNGLLPRSKATPRNTWERRHDGEFPVWEPPEGHELDGVFDYVVTRFEYLEDVDELVVEGVNPEIANPLDILVTNERLEEVYEDLLHEKADYQRYKARERSRRMEYDKQHVNALMAALEHGLEFEPGTIESIQRGDEEHVDQMEEPEPERSDDQEERPTLTEMLGGSNQQAAATDGGRPK